MSTVPSPLAQGYSDTSLPIIDPAVPVIGNASQIAPGGGKQVMTDEQAEKVGNISLTFGRSGYIAGHVSPDGQLLLGFSRSDGRPIFGVGGDMASRFNALEAYTETVSLPRAGVLWGLRAPNGQLPVYVSSLTGKTYLAGRDVCGEIDGLVSRVDIAEEKVEYIDVAPPGRSGVLAGLIFPNRQMPWHVDAAQGRFYANGRYVAGELDALAAAVAAGPDNKVTKFTMLGDSMSADYAVGGAIASALPPGIASYQQGIGGKRTLTVSAMFGGAPLNVVVTGGQIPTTGESAVTPHSSMVGDLNNLGGTDAVMLVLASGVLCELRYYTSGSTYALKPVDYPAAAISVGAYITLEPLTGWAAGTNGSNCVPFRTMFSDAMIGVRVGVNDAYNRADAQLRVAEIKMLETSLRRYTDKVVFFGSTNGWADLPAALGGVSGSSLTEAQSEQRLGFIAGFNAALSREMRHFIDPLANHISKGAGESKTVNGRTFTVLTSTASTQVLSDGRHENATGQAYTRDLFLDYASELGWI